MSRCGSCPIYEHTEYGIYCDGNFGVEECADKLQDLYYAMSHMINRAKSGESISDILADMEREAKPAGNRRLVNMVGTMSREEATSIVQLLSADGAWNTPAACLKMEAGVYSLATWVARDGTIAACGILSERDCCDDDVEDALEFLAKRFPSLELTLHLGGDWQDSTCAATFHVRNGTVKRCKPEIEQLRPKFDQIGGDRKCFW